MSFKLFDGKGKHVGYKRVSSAFGVPYDYSQDGKIWITPKVPFNMLIEHAFSNVSDKT